MYQISEGNESNRKMLALLLLDVKPRFSLEY